MKLFSPRSHSPGWMITLADLLSLLVSFFALLYAATATDPARWNRTIKPISAYMTGAPIVETTEKTMPVLPQNFSQNYAASVLSRLLDSDPAFSGARVTVGEHDTRVIFLPRQNLMEWLDAAPSPLAEMAQTLNNLQLPVDVILFRGIDAENPGAATFDGALREANAIARRLKEFGLYGTIRAIGMVEPVELGTRRLELSIPNANAAPALTGDRAGGRSGR